ncbi:MAG TPA: metallophosphoesterase family protein [Anaeromyxobacteraceae bacterium]|nr:metallophosphoesterase family protein [Anaeromyxobacteraceae bacterium]
MPPPPCRVGLVSDTHDVFDPKLETLFAGCDLILHAGDVTRQPVLDALSVIAPVRAVRGNNDFGPFAEALPETAVVALGGLSALLVHEVSPARPSPSVQRALSRSGARLVVHGHSHRPGTSLQDGVLFVNPGSAGPPRFRLPRSAALLEVLGRRVRLEIRDLSHPGLPLIGDALVTDL